MQVAWNTRNNKTIHAKPDLRVFLKWMIAGSGSVIVDVIWLKLTAIENEIEIEMTKSANETPRLVLWSGDSPRNSVDSVCESIITELKAYLNDSEDDSCFVNDVIAYVRCLTGVYDWAGGAYVELEELESWRKRTTTVIEGMPESYFQSEPDRKADLNFANEVFDDLRNIVKRMYDDE